MGESGSMKKLRIDWNNLIEAFASGHEDYRCYLDLQSGAVVWKSEQVVVQTIKEAKKKLDDQLIEVPTITDRENWELMMAQVRGAVQLRSPWGVLV